MESLLPMTDGFRAAAGASGAALPSWAGLVVLVVLLSAAVFVLVHRRGGHRRGHRHEHRAGAQARSWPSA
ncbi:hypothetical protein [Jannaschia sp. R86511]|uniref:hypothetical protein n=1 Tax=Jannaschia sp. R86511 TaxID=3093853 RepID=UPI0036D21451